MSSLPLQSLIIAAFAAVAGVVGPLLLWRRPMLGHWLGGAVAAVASVAALVAAIAVLSGAPPLRLGLVELYPFGVLSLRLDPLAAAFLALTGALGAVVSIYGLGYARHYAESKHLGLLAALLCAFLLALGLVPLADHAVGLMLAWELMALTSFLLVAFEHEREATRRAAVFYAVMTHVGAGFLFAALLLFGGQAQTFSFDGLRQAAPALPAGLQAAVFSLALVGFGTKAGVLPLHGWLPEAHPAAPAHVSALMSGAMITTGVYGLLRVAFDLLAGPPAWWGLLVLTLGAVTALMGALYAMAESNLKRLLAYSSIEHMGITLTAVGAALFFKAIGQGPLAALALVAALYHLWNHAAFKGLLFCGAGAVQFAAHTVDLERLGGLIRRMPATALFMLVGLLAITAMPLFNGFVSEWLILQALFGGLWVDDVAARLALPLAASAIALTGGLALVAFVKAYAVGFLAKGRSPEAERATEVPGLMRGAMGALAISCLALGLAPAAVVPVLNRVVAPLVGATMPEGQAWLLVPVRPELSSLSVGALWGLLAIALPVAIVLPRLLGGRTRTRRAPTWTCGMPGSPRTQYSAMGYAQPLRTIFGRLLMPHAQEMQPDATVAPYFKREVRYALVMEAVAERFLYAPVTRWTLGAARQLTRIQSGSIHLYLAYIFFSLVVVLVIMRGLG